MALGKSTVVDHSRAAGLRRAIGLILVAGLCVSAVTFYRDAELPRSAPAVATQYAVRNSFDTNRPHAFNLAVADDLTEAHSYDCPGQDETAEGSWYH